MKHEIVAPDPQLLESMRSVGYTVEAAVADVMDNSVAAAATNISLHVSPAGPFEMAIVDDGTGMSPEGAVDAMRLAARSPSDERGPHDLGRFGLGLKTASLSQCRRLTVVTKRDGVLTALCWSLDYVIQTNSWSLLRLDEDECESLLGWTEFEAYESGTLVNWRDLDQLQITEGSDQESLDRAIIRVRDHIGLVFHRFISGTDAPKTFIRCNGGAIAALDPFLAAHRSTQVGPVESIDVGGETVTTQAFTLPYLARLGGDTRREALKLGQLRDTQGFYVYRARRLVIWGTWFRVTPRTELAKLTRVRVDVPNTLDQLWSLDIKKSAADPPPEVRRRLKELAARMTTPSHRTQRFRGRKVKADDPVDRVWGLIEDRDEFRYEINRDHPSLARLTDELSPAAVRNLEMVLNMIEATFPVVDAHNRLSSDGVSSQHMLTDEQLLTDALTLWPRFRELDFTVDGFIDVLTASEPYNLSEQLPKLLRQEITS